METVQQHVGHSAEGCAGPLRAKGQRSERWETKWKPITVLVCQTHLCPQHTCLKLCLAEPCVGMEQAAESAGVAWAFSFWLCLSHLKAASSITTPPVMPSKACWVPGCFCLSSSCPWSSLPPLPMDRSYIKFHFSKGSMEWDGIYEMIFDILRFRLSSKKCPLAGISAWSITKLPLQNL